MYECMYYIHLVLVAGSTTVVLVLIGCVHVVQNNALNTFNECVTCHSHSHSECMMSCHEMYECCSYPEGNDIECCSYNNTLQQCIRTNINTNSIQNVEKC